MKGFVSTIDIRRQNISLHNVTKAWFREFVASTPDLSEYEVFKRKGVHHVPLNQPWVAFRGQIEDPAHHPFPTPSGKIEIYSQKIAGLQDLLIPSIPKYIEAWEDPSDPIRTGTTTGGRSPNHLITTIMLQCSNTRNASNILMNKEGWQKDTARVLRLRWLIVGSVGVTLVINTLQRVSLTVVADRVMAEFELTAVAFGSLAALFFYVYAVVQIPAGIMVDTLGVKRTITLGCLTAGLGSIIFGLAPSLPVAYIGRFLVAFGLGVQWLCMLKLLTEWFRAREFAIMSGFAAAFAQIGALLGATPLAILVVHAGWRVSFELVGLVNLAVAAACWLIVRNRPTDIGLPSLAEIESYESGSSQGLPRPPTSVPGISLMAKLKTMLSNKHSWPPLLVSLGSYAPFSAFASTWGVPYIMQVYGMSREAAANYTLVGTLGFIVGFASIGYISDRLMARRKLPIILMSLASLVVWLVLILWNGGKPPQQFLYPICFFMGASATAVIISFACAKEVNLPTVSGVAMGFTNMGPFIGTALLQPLVGYMLDLGWQGAVVQGARVYPLSAYQSGFMLCLASTLIAIVAGLLTKETRCKNIYL